MKQEHVKLIRAGQTINSGREITKRQEEKLDTEREYYKIKQET